MLLSRATIIVSKMPHRLSVDDLTREEAHELWAFLSSEDRLSMTRQAVKVQLAKECGVFIEQMDAVANGATLTELLVWESSDSEGCTLTLSNITAMFRGSLNDEWIIEFSHLMNSPYKQTFNGLNHFVIVFLISNLNKVFFSVYFNFCITIFRN